MLYGVAMTILTRLLRLLTIIVHRTLDQFENKRLVLQQCFRDMETALAQKEAHLKQLNTCCEQIRLEAREYTHAIEALERNTQMAIEQQKDELARGLLKRIQVLTHHHEVLDSDLHAMDDTITQMRTSLSDQQYRYQQIRLQAETSLRRTRQEHLAHTSFLMFHMNCQVPSDEQIELELLQRKEALKGDF